MPLPFRICCVNRRTWPNTYELSKSLTSTSMTDRRAIVERGSVIDGRWLVGTS